MLDGGLSESWLLLLNRMEWLLRILVWIRKRCGRRVEVWLSRRKLILRSHHGGPILCLDRVQVGVRVAAMGVLVRTCVLETAVNTVVIAAVSTHGELWEMCHILRTFARLGWGAGWYQR